MPSSESFLFSGSLKLPGSRTEDLFRGWLDQAIDLRHSLAVVSTRMPLQEIEASSDRVVARKVKEGKWVKDIALFGPVVQVSGSVVSNAGRPRFPMRLLVSFLYLKHTYNLSDEELVVSWSENVYYQFRRGWENYEPNETINGLYKTEVVRNKGPWRTVEALERETLNHGHWFNQERLFESFSHIEPEVFDAPCERRQQECSTVV